MLPRALESATCVQRFDDSLNSAIRITYRISLRSSSLREPRYPLLTVVRFQPRRCTCVGRGCVLANCGVIKGREPGDLVAGRCSAYSERKALSLDNQRHFQ